jgi:hypothetical protein
VKRIIDQGADYDDPGSDWLLEQYSALSGTMIVRYGSVWDRNSPWSFARVPLRVGVGYESKTEVEEGSSTDVQIAFKWLNLHQACA